MGEEAERWFPCPLCGVGLPVKADRRGRPYVICEDCGLQLFVRTLSGAERLFAICGSGYAVLPDWFVCSRCRRVAVHSKEEKVKCPVCGRVIARRPARARLQLDTEVTSGHF